MSTEQAATATLDNIAAAIEAPRPARKKPAPRHDFGDGRGKVLAHKHANGGGWVADTAKVADEVFVGRRASVYHRASVSGDCHIADNAAICGRARIDATGTIDGGSFIAGNTDIKGNVTIIGYARLYGGAFTGTTRIGGHVRVQNSPTIHSGDLRSTCFIAGNAVIINSIVGDRAMVGQHAYVVKSSVFGDAIVTGHAFVVQSQLRYVHSLPRRSDSPTHLLIDDHARLIDTAAIDALLHIKGRGVVVNSAIRFRPYIEGNGAYERIECVENMCIANDEIYTIPEFEQRNSTTATLRGRLPAGPAASRAAFNLENIVPQRRLTPALQ